MIIVYVIDSFGEFSNEATIFASCSKKILEEMGHMVRVVSNTKLKGEEYFNLQNGKSKTMAKQKYYFAKPDKEVFRKAFEGADIVHFFYPSKAGKVAIKVAKEMGIPVTGSYYCLEHRLAHKRRFYRKIDRVHCPSLIIANQLRDHRYKNIFHPITIGVGKENLDSIQNYQIEVAVKRLEEMFNVAIKDNKINNLEKEAAEKKYLKRLKQSKIGFLILKLFYLLLFPFGKLYAHLFGKLHIKGKKNLKSIKGGAIIISNHVHNFDAPINTCAVYPRLPVFTSQPANFEHKVYGLLIKMFGAIPTPVGLNQTKIFINEITKKVKNGRLVLIYPEGNLIYKNKDLQKFKKGAFYIAQNAMAPIVPARISFLEKKKKNGKIKKRVILNIGKPIYPNFAMTRKESIDNLMETSLAALESLKVEEYK